MAQQRNRNLGGDGDGRGVDELSGLRSHEGRSHDGSTGAVHDQARLAVGVVAHQGGARRGGVGHTGGDDIHARIARLRLSESAGGHLRVGEDHLGNRDVGGDRLGGPSGGARPDPLPDDPGLILAHMSQRRLAAGIADRVEPLREPAADDVVGAQPHRLQTDPVQGGPAAGGHHDLVGVEGLLIAQDAHRTAVDAARTPIGGPGALAGGHSGPGENPDPAFRQGLGHDLGGEGLGPGQQARAAHEHGHLAAQGGHPGGGLAGHDASADDDEPLGHLLDPGGVARSPWMNVLQLGGDDGLRAIGQDDGSARLQQAHPLGGAHHHSALSVQARPAAHHVDAGAGGPEDLPGVVVMGDPLVATLEQAGRRYPGGLQAGEVSRGARHLQRAEQGLARHAGVVRAVPAHQPALDEHGAQAAALGGVLSNVLAGRSRTDDGDVIDVVLVMVVGEVVPGSRVIARAIAADVGGAVHGADTVTRGCLSDRAVPLFD